jgi:hypothetical protein
MAEWSTDAEKRLIAYWRTKMTQAEIARQLDFSAASISTRAAQLGLRARGGPPSPDKLYLMQDATRRGLTVRRLSERLLHTIAHDRMVVAILDDEPVRNEHARSPAPRA